MKESLTSYIRLRALIKEALSPSSKDNLKEWGIRDFTSPPKHKPGPGEYGSVRISVVDDEIDILNDPNNLIDFDYTLEGNELWVWEDDKEEAYNYLGIQ